MVRQAGGAPVGQLGRLRPIVNRPTAAIAADSGGSQPPRRLPACPTSRQRFHFNVVHPWCLGKSTKLPLDWFERSNSGQIALRRIILWKMPSVDNVRPNPEELLRKVQADERRESRGRLKVFLGYASRVGKSFRMFDEGRRRKERGQDVVVAAIQFPLTPDLEALMATLEYIPTLKEVYAGNEYEV